MTQTTHNYFNQYRGRTLNSLEHWLPKETTFPTRLHQAMRYSALNTGKCVRPTLVYATGKALGVPLEILDSPACAVELIHIYSLIHDDLPCMDDDDLRRGKLTCHIVYDEAVAILAGDALQALAYHILSHSNTLKISAEMRLKMLDHLTLACGSRGLVGGQDVDLNSVNKQLSITELEDMHIHKTGALIRASVMLASYCKESLDTKKAQQLDHYAKCIGLAFQIRDDILDFEGSTTILGKTSGKDSANSKATYTSILGISTAKEKANDLYHESIKSLQDFGEEADELRMIAQFIIERNH
ncbi:MAG: geranyl transferase [Methylococcales bacterium]|jgi:geranylgeranyl pyrophosphate synthase|nr:geranyl transferase [Methylococcales bacterium]MBT7409279.1 geranyl transferase [Methylococcales bacterium]